VVFASTHAPAPSHVESGLKVDPAHDFGLHTTALPLAKPSQVVVCAGIPSHSRASQAPAVPEHAVRAPCGLPVTGVHVPTAPAMSQAWHWPSHAVSQHAPSTQ
jgi:hypothetical protein